MPVQLRAVPQSEPIVEALSRDCLHFRADDIWISFADCATAAALQCFTPFGAVWSSVLLAPRGSCPENLRAIRG
eukprot:15259033-Alexandrium_andersonii.AAC.1